MPDALKASDVTVTLVPEDIDRSPDRRTRTLPTVSFGDGADTYPALGIPMPPVYVFGVNFKIDRVAIEQPANGYVYHFDRANHKIRIFQGNNDGLADGPLVELGAVAVAATTLYLDVLGS
jgi:hypothetical protein